MMDYKLAKLDARWPHWFKNCYVSCGPGWFDLLWDLCEKIERLDPGPDFEIRDVKEKFGGLRFYISAVHQDKADAVYALIDEAEQRASITCDTCGLPGETRYDRGWILTLCDTCNVKAEV